MSLKKSVGNMYDWVSHMHSHLGGECPHRCSYCYVQKNRFGVPERYKGGLRLIEKEFEVNYGSNKTIFIEHMNDMFATDVPRSWVDKILTHCQVHPNNLYVFQTKNPLRVLDFEGRLPRNHIIGTTIETNREIEKGFAPTPRNRFIGIKKISELGGKTFITIEPVMDFDVDILAQWVIEAQPEFINIGADSKGCGLPEPTAEKILGFVEILQKNKITIRKKVNLERILKEKT